MSMPDDLPIHHFKDQKAWEKWLIANAGGKGVWLRIARKDSGMHSVNYAQALEVALCHGWIDGQKRGCDEQSFLQRFTPRRPRSLWSKINIDRAERLIAAGRMQAGGLREVEAARADGRWEAAYHGFSSMEVPAELAAALDKNKKAKACFDRLDKTNRYSFCWRVHTAKKAETRVARAEKFVEMLARRSTEESFSL